MLKNAIASPMDRSPSATSAVSFCASDMGLSPSSLTLSLRIRSVIRRRFHHGCIDHPLPCLRLPWNTARRTEKMIHPDFARAALEARRRGRVLGWSSNLRGREPEAPGPAPRPPRHSYASYEPHLARLGTISG